MFHKKYDYSYLDLLPHDLLKYMMNYFSITTTLKLCKSNTFAYLCNDEKFWKMIFINKISSVVVPDYVNKWHIENLVYDLERYHPEIIKSQMTDLLIYTINHGYEKLAHSILQFYHNYYGFNITEIKTALDQTKYQHVGVYINELLATYKPKYKGSFRLRFRPRADCVIL